MQALLMIAGWMKILNWTQATLIKLYKNVEIDLVYDPDLIFISQMVILLSNTSGPMLMENARMDLDQDDVLVTINGSLVPPPPPFVGINYYCESDTSNITSNNVLYSSDILWDGEQCDHLEAPCYSYLNMPWIMHSMRLQLMTLS